MLRFFCVFFSFITSCNNTGNNPQKLGKRKQSSSSLRVGKKLHVQLIPSKTGWAAIRTWWSKKQDPLAGHRTCSGRDVSGSTNAPCERKNSSVLCKGIYVNWANQIHHLPEAAVQFFYPWAFSVNWNQKLSQILGRWRRIRKHITESIWSSMFTIQKWMSKTPRRSVLEEHRAVAVRLSYPKARRNYHNVDKETGP